MSKKGQAESTASAHWSGDLVGGSGSVTSSGSGLLSNLPVSWATRTGSGKQGETTPEELLAAAHATCFAMALSYGLAGAGSAPESLDVSAKVGFDPKVGGGFEVSFSELTVRGRVPGMTAEQFAEAAQAASQGCPISGALKGNVEVTVNAELV